MSPSQTLTTIQFVGAGPGAVDLITVRGMNALQQAQVVLYDALIDQAMLQYAHPDAVLVNVGKRAARCESKKQDVINNLLVEYGQQYQRVVRLKGGDPSIFGRLDEEIQTVRSAGYAFDIIPGVSSVLAAAASAKTPLTKRGIARSVRLMTASVGEDQPDNLWHAHLSPTETLVFYMGGQHRQKIGQILIEKGFDPATPVILVFGASWAHEIIERTDLAGLANASVLIDGEQNPEAHDAPCMTLVGMGLGQV